MFRLRQLLRDGKAPLLCRNRRVYHGRMNRVSAALIALLVLAASATAYDRRIRITNGASEPLTALQMAAEGGALQADALGGTALSRQGRAGRAADVSGACLYS